MMADFFRCQSMQEKLPVAGIMYALVFYLNYEMIYGGKNGDYNTIFIN